MAWKISYTNGLDSSWHTNTQIEMARQAELFGIDLHFLCGTIMHGGLGVASRLHENDAKCICISRHDVIATTSQLACSEVLMPRAHPYNRRRSLIRPIFSQEMASLSRTSFGALLTGL